MNMNAVDGSTTYYFFYITLSLSLPLPLRNALYSSFATDCGLTLCTNDEWSG